MPAHRHARTAAAALAAAIAVTTVCVASAGTASATRLTATGDPSLTATSESFRQLLGYVDGPASFEASTPTAGSYVIEYTVTGTAFFDTYVNGTELGYVGGPTGTYRTRMLPLSAGGQLVHVAGPEGAGTASVYLVQIS